MARQQAVDPPRLWLMEDMDAAGAVRAAAYVCADTPMRKTFAKTTVPRSRAPCRRHGPAGAAAGVCGRIGARRDGRRYAITSETVGDPERDFRLTVMVTPLSADLGPARTTRHYRRLGACPAGWRIGDLQLRPGSRR